MSIPGQLNPPARLLLGPGPSDAHPRVLAAMTTPLLGHLDPHFMQLMGETQEMLREAYGTANPLTFPVSTRDWRWPGWKRVRCQPDRTGRPNGHLLQRLFRVSE